MLIFLMIIIKYNLPTSESVVPVLIQVSKFRSLARWSLGSGPSTIVCTERSKYLNMFEHFSLLQRIKDSGAFNSTSIFYGK